MSRKKKPARDPLLATMPGHVFGNGADFDKTKLQPGDAVHAIEKSGDTMCTIHLGNVRRAASGSLEISAFPLARLPMLDLLQFMDDKCLFCEIEDEDMEAIGLGDGVIDRTCAFLCEASCDGFVLGEMDAWTAIGLDRMWWALQKSSGKWWSLIAGPGTVPEGGRLRGLLSGEYLCWFNEWNAAVTEDVPELFKNYGFDPKAVIDAHEDLPDDLMRTMKRWVEKRDGEKEGEARRA